MLGFTFVTQSRNKIAEAERILNVKLKHHLLELPEIQSVELEEVIRNKAEYAYKGLGKKPVMVEDTGLYFVAWNGLPGALIKWFLQYTGDEGICGMMQAFPNRLASAKTIVATHNGEMRLFTGCVQGQIALAPKGEKGFGWDSIFIPDGATRTFAQMAAHEKDRYSMRRLAFESMKSYYL